MIMGKSVEVNEVYNDLKILNFSSKDKHGKKLYECKCLLCGSLTIKRGTDIKNSVVKSCGCLAKNNAVKHGMRNTSLYKRWKGMKSRCYSKSYHAYERYHGRNITVCRSWRKDFMNFYNDMNSTFFEGAELDRIDNEKGYSPDNCRWVTHKVNSNNRGKYRNKTGYTGVHYRENKKSYEVNFCVNRKPIHIGVYPTIKKAVNGRKNYIIEYNKKHNTDYKYEDFKE